MLIIDGVCIKDASGGGDVLIVTTRGKETWLDPDTAANLLGRGYFDNKELRKLMDDDFNKAMEQCTATIITEGPKSFKESFSIKGTTTGRFNCSKENKAANPRSESAVHTYIVEYGSKND